MIELHVFIYSVVVRCINDTKRCILEGELRCDQLKKIFVRAIRWKQHMVVRRQIRYNLQSAVRPKFGPISWNSFAS